MPIGANNCRKREKSLQSLLNWRYFFPIVGVGLSVRWLWGHQHSPGVIQPRLYERATILSTQYGSWLGAPSGNRIRAARFVGEHSFIKICGFICENVNSMAIIANCFGYFDERCKGSVLGWNTRSAAIPRWSHGSRQIVEVKRTWAGVTDPAVVGPATQQKNEFPQETCKTWKLLPVLCGKEIE